MKLVGLVINSEMTWDDHLDYTILRVTKTLWQLIRFRKLGADTYKLITFYILKVRSILMFGAVCFHSFPYPRTVPKVGTSAEKKFGHNLGI